MFPSNLCSLNRGFSDVFNLKEQNVNIFQTSVDQIPHLKNKTSTIPSSGIHFSGSFVYLFVSSPQSCNIACQSAQSHKMSRYLYVNDIILSFFSVFFYYAWFTIRPDFAGIWVSVPSGQTFSRFSDFPSPHFTVSSPPAAQDQNTADTKPPGAIHRQAWFSTSSQWKSQKCLNAEKYSSVSV